MKKHLKLLRYTLVHKWHVLRAGRRLGVGWFRLVIHDWSKFLPSEWFPYADFFYSGDRRPDAMHEPGDNLCFDRAWLYHQHRNPHHWQYWVLRQDEGGCKCIPMPEKYAREMVADWVGAGRAQGRMAPDAVKQWYETNKGKIVLHHETKQVVVRLIDGYVRLCDTKKAK